MTKHKILKTSKGKGHMIMLVLLTMISLVSCDDYFEYDLPEAGSKPDQTPPTASFGATQSDGDWQTFNFANFSSNATDYLWDFGNGNTSSNVDAVFTFPGEGTYSVSLTASDKLGVESKSTQEIEVIEPEAPSAMEIVILNPSFDEPGSNDKYTEPWIPPSDMGKLLQISSSSSFVGGKAGKFPDAASDPRIAYQQDIALTPNTDYVITYYYSIEEGDPSTLTVAILGGNVSTASEVAGATIASFTGDVQAGKSGFQKVDINFNSGANAIISIHVSNTGPKTAYIEEFSSAIVE
jgi:PKD repeat protein